MVYNLFISYNINKGKNSDYFAVLRLALSIILFLLVYTFIHNTPFNFLEIYYHFSNPYLLSIYLPFVTYSNGNRIIKYKSLPHFSDTKLAELQEKYPNKTEIGI